MNWQIDTQCEEIYDKFLTVAQKNGWQGSVFHHNDEFFRYVHERNGQLHGTKHICNKYLRNMLSLKEAFNRIQHPPPYKTQIAGYNIELTSEGIKIGCQLVKKEKVDEIYKKLYEDNVILNLTSHEARALFCIMSRVSGDPLESRRKFSHAVVEQLEEYFDPYNWGEANDLTGKLKWNNIE